MGRHVAAVLLGAMAAGSAGAQTAGEAFTAGRELLLAGQYLDAAAAFHRALLDEGLGRFTLRVAVYCDIANLEGHVRTSRTPPELIVLRRSVGGRPCLGLYWGLYPSREAARAALTTVPSALRTAGQSPVAVAEILPPGEPPPVRIAAPPPPVAPPEPPSPPVVAEAEPEAEPLPEPEVADAAPPPIEPAPVAPPPYAPVVLPSAAAAAALVRVPAVEIAARYSYLWDDSFADDDRGSFELGWMLSGCANLGRGLGIVGDVSGHYRSERVLDVLGAPIDLDLDVLGIHAGLRYTHRHDGFATPYVQALAGVTRTGVEIGRVREVEDDFSIQPGVGVVFRLSDSVGIGAGADYRLVFGESQNRNELRLHAGLDFAIGNR